MVQLTTQITWRHDGTDLQSCCWGKLYICFCTSGTVKPLFYGTPDQRKPLFYEQNNFNGTLFSANSPLMNGNPSNAIYGPVPTEPKPLISEQILIFL